MSEQDVEVARRVLDAFNRGDRDGQRLLRGFRASYLRFAEAFNCRDFEASFAPIPPDVVFDPLVAERGQGEALAGELSRAARPRGADRVLSHDWVEEFPDAGVMRSRPIRVSQHLDEAGALEATGLEE